ncbi:MAG: TolC family protein [Ignavibacteria bacterium]|nr:TolC family protein [Ignavibacteria bacterium]
MKHYYLFLAASICMLFSLLSHTNAQSSQPLVLTLQDALKIATEKNWDVKIAHQDILKAEQQINEAYSNAYPSLSFSGKYMRNIKLPVMFIPPNTAFNPSSETQTFELGSNNSVDASVTLSQVIYSQKVNTAIKIADEYASYSKTALTSTRLQTIVQVKKAFYSVMLMQELLSVARKNLEAASANFTNVAAQYKQGVSSEYDYLRADVQKSNAQPLVIQTENNLELAKNYLKTLLALPMESALEVKGQFLLEEVPTQVLEEKNATAINMNPVVQQLKINESLLDKNLIIERSEYYPTLALFGQYEWQSQDNTLHLSNYKWAESFVLGLQLSYNIFDGFRRGARIEQVKIDINKVSLARKKLEEALVIQVQQAQMKMAESKKRIKAQEKSLKQAEKTLSIAETRYKSGVGTQLEIIDTQAALVYARTNYVQAVFDYLSAKADWEYAVSLE